MRTRRLPSRYKSQLIVAALWDRAHASYRISANWPFVWLMEGTHPDSGYLLSNSIWWLATGSPSSLNIRNRVDVVPWSMLPTKECSLFVTVDPGLESRGRLAVFTSPDGLALRDALVLCDMLMACGFVCCTRQLRPCSLAGGDAAVGLPVNDNLLA